MSTKQDNSLISPVSKRCNDETLSAAGVLVAVSKINISDGNLAFIGVFNVVEARLLQPLKIGGRFNVKVHLKSRSRNRLLYL